MTDGCLSCDCAILMCGFTLPYFPSSRLCRAEVQNGFTLSHFLSSRLCRAEVQNGGLASSRLRGKVG